MTSLAWAIVGLVAVVLAYRVAVMLVARLDQSKEISALRADYERHRAMFIESFKVVDKRLGEVELAVRE